MKSNRLVMSIIIAVLLSVGYCIKAMADETTQTELSDETYVQHCRCHDDGECYGGNAISFRPSCGSYKIPVGTVVACWLNSDRCEPW